MRLVSPYPERYPLFMSGLGGITSEMSASQLVSFLMSRVPQGTSEAGVKEVVKTIMFSRRLVQGSGLNALSLSEVLEWIRLPVDVNLHQWEDQKDNPVARAFRELDNGGWVFVNESSPFARAQAAPAVSIKPIVAASADDIPSAAEMARAEAQAKAQPKTAAKKSSVSSGSEDVMRIYASLQKSQPQQSAAARIKSVSVAKSRLQAARASSAGQSQKPIWPWILLGLGVTFAGVALYFGIRDAEE